MLHFLFAAWIGAFMTFITVCHDGLRARADQPQFIFWLVGAIVYHLVRFRGSCDGTGFASRCRQLLAVEVIAWIEMALALLVRRVRGFVADCAGPGRHRLPRPRCVDASRDWPDALRLSWSSHLSRLALLGQQCPSVLTRDLG